MRERDVLVDLFIQSHDRPPTHLTFDIDACDDPAHGQQQLTMFHGYDERPQYLPIAITLYLHTAALNLLVRLRRAVRQSVATPTEPEDAPGLAAEALDEPARKRPFNRRRERDPLGGGFASTGRSRLIKVAAEVVVRVRRVEDLFASQRSDPRTHCPRRPHRPEAYSVGIIRGRIIEAPPVRPGFFWILFKPS